MSEQISDFCECGHMRHDHLTMEGFGGPKVGGCTGKRDTRGLNAGGSELSPCPCMAFKPLGFSNVAAVSGGGTTPHKETSDQLKERP